MKKTITALVLVGLLVLSPTGDAFAQSRRLEEKWSILRPHANTNKQISGLFEADNGNYITVGTAGGPPTKVAIIEYSKEDGSLVSEKYVPGMMNFFDFSAINDGKDGYLFLTVGNWQNPEDTFDSKTTLRVIKSDASGKVLFTIEEVEGLDVKPKSIAAFNDGSFAVQYSEGNPGEGYFDDPADSCHQFIAFFDKDGKLTSKVSEAHDSYSANDIESDGENVAVFGSSANTDGSTQAFARIYGKDGKLKHTITLNGPNDESFTSAYYQNGKLSFGGSTTSPALFGTATKLPKYAFIADYDASYKLISNKIWSEKDDVRDEKISAFDVTSIAPLLNGGKLVSYRINREGKGGTGANVVAYDAKGEIEFAKSFGAQEKTAANWTKVSDVRIMSDGSLVSLGISNSGLFLDGRDTALPTARGERAFISRFAPKQVKINFANSSQATIKPSDTVLPDGTVYQSGLGLNLGAPQTKEDYEFAGWFFDEALTDPYIESELENYEGEELTLYPKWVKKVANPDTIDGLGGIAKTAAAVSIPLVALLFVLKRRH